MCIKTTAIGIAGTAKNTGKTTASSAIIEQVYERQWVLGLTSIGYDGETIDNITGLPKPRVHVLPGTFLAIAEQCLKPSTAEIEVLEKTELVTPLGKVIIGEVKQEGLVVVAGPNKSSDLRLILEKLKKLNCRLIIVDGALNRLAPMVETDGLILSTGASRNPDINVLAGETELFWQALQLPITGVNKYFLSNLEIVIIVYNDNNGRSSSYKSILSEQAAEDICWKITSKSRSLLIPGIVDFKIFNKIIDRTIKICPQLELVFSDPVKIIISGNLNKFLKLFEKIKKAGGSVSVVNSISLLAVTVNPFYPNFRVKANLYQAAYMDKEILKNTIQEIVNVPVVNVVDDGGTKIVDIIERKTSKICC